MCRSRRELSHEYLFAKFGFDTAENEHCRVCPLSAYRSPRCKYMSECTELLNIAGDGLERFEGDCQEFVTFRVTPSAYSTTALDYAREGQNGLTYPPTGKNLNLGCPHEPLVIWHTTAGVEAQAACRGTSATTGCYVPA